MVKRVLVAVDGTPASNMALEIACALADNYEAALGLLSVTRPDEISDEIISAAELEGVIQPGSTFTSVSDAVNTSTLWQQTRHAESAAMLASALAERIVERAKAFSSDKPFQAIKTFVSSGDPAKSILSCADENAADIIIMGHDQQGRVEALFKRSVAETVQAKAKCPVLIFSLPKEK